jgi:hypothetical protein
LDRLPEAEQIIEATEERRAEVDLHRVRGDLLTAMGDRAAVEKSYNRALAVAERQRANCGSPVALPTTGVIKANGSKPALSSLRSKAGSQRVSMRRCSKTQRRCSTSCRDLLG